MTKLRPAFLAIAVILSIGAFAYGSFLIAGSMSPELAGAVITAASTVIISVMTIAFGRYFEKKRELEALHREKKIPIYAEFLEGVTNVFYGGKVAKRVDTLGLLQKWQQKIVLWGGSDVVNAYMRWKHQLTTSQPTAESMRLTNDLILAIRNELGHDNVGLIDDLFPRLILKDYENFAEAAKVDPHVSLASLSELEAKAKATRTES